MKLALYALGVGLIVFTGALYLQLELNPDQAIFAYIGWMATKGAKFYVDVAEQNWPGAMLLHEWAIRLFGATAWSFRLLDYLIAIVAGGALTILLADPQRPQDRLAGILIFFWHPIAHASGGTWFAGSRDSVGGNLLVMMAAALALAVRRRQLGWLVPAGLLGFFAVMVRPTYLLFSPLLAIGAWPAAKKAGLSFGAYAGRVAVVLVTFLAALAGLLAWGVHTGGLEAFWIQGVKFNVVSGYVVSEFHWYFFWTFWRQWFYALPGLVILGRIWLTQRHDGLVMATLVSLTITSGVSYLVMGKGFGYHLGGLVPVLTTGCAVAFVQGLDFARARGSKQAWGAFAVLALVLVAGQAKISRHWLKHSFWHVAGRLDEQGLLDSQETNYVHEAIPAARYIKETTEPGDTVVPWHRLAIINYAAQRELPFRYVTTGALELFRAPFEQADAWTEEVRKALEARPPKIYITRTEHEMFPEDPTPAWQLIRDDLEKNFEKDKVFGQSTVWRRVTRTATTSTSTTAP